MPWLMIFMTLPMLLLAALGLEPCVLVCGRFVRERLFSGAARSVVVAEKGQEAIQARAARTGRVSVGRFALSTFGVIMALLLLIPTLHNMIEVAYVNPADGPHEMMVYVQTPNDINSVMQRIEQVDAKNFGGKHQVAIGVTTDAEWPFAWYLRDYPHVCYNFPVACPDWKATVPIIISSNDAGDPLADISTYAPGGKDYSYQIYNLRTWWDEGYKLPPCKAGQAPSTSCADPGLGSGVGPLLWLSYGDNPPRGATFNLGLTGQRVWNWWWKRQPFGSSNGGYPMVLLIRDTMHVLPTPP
jgi:hypothetical protein